MELSQRLFDFIYSHLCQSGFSSLLLPKHSFARESVTLLGDELTIVYKVPISLCLQRSTGVHVLPVSSILALFDDISSYGLMIRDRNHRPGMSINLSTEIVRTCVPEDSVRLVSKCDKIGKTIAFLSIEMQSLSGEVLARGKHIKYVHMGFLWNLLTSFILFPIVLYILERMRHSKSAKSARHTEEVCDNESVFKKIDLEPISDPSTLLIKPSHSKGGSKKTPKALMIEEDKEKCFAVIASKGMLNALGKMHGGAVAVAAEDAIIRSFGSSDTSLLLDSMNVTYVSPLSGKSVVVVRESPPTHGAHGRRNFEGRLVSVKTGKLCAQFAVSGYAK